MSDDDHLKFLREQLMQSSASLERAHDEIKRHRLDGRAAASTVEALMFSLRERGVAALKERDTRRRLGELDDRQLIEVGRRCQALKLGLGSWSEAAIEQLMRLHAELRR
jgi:hypothetical protein